jgi:hypothetical protein
MGSGIGLEAKVHAIRYRVSDNLSSYFLCSNDSNGIHMGRKLMSGMGMHRNLARETRNWCLFEVRLSPVRSEGSEVKTSTLKT